jgi:tetratricopeptide (TPR) repeat protein
MKYVGGLLTTIGLVFLLNAGVMAADVIAEADSLYEQGGLQNYLKAAELLKQAVTADPDSYEANWKLARALRYYGNTAKNQLVEGWEDICATYGKEAMQYAQKAIDLEPNKPDGHYFYGLSVGVYSDGVSVFTALKEGLKDKTQSSFEKTYEIDKMYRDGGPMLSLGRFWSVLPWPMRDRKKALSYLREYQATPYFKDNYEAYVYLSEVLIGIGGDANKAEAKGLLEDALKSEDAYYRDQARKMLEDLK